MRGKAVELVSSGMLNGITPAYAGKSFPETGSNTLHKDHPRLCGEKQRDVSTELLQKGSPPPMRGKVE